MARTVRRDPWRDGADRDRDGGGRRAGRGARGARGPPGGSGGGAAGRPARRGGHDGDAHGVRRSAHSARPAPVRLGLEPADDAVLVDGGPCRPRGRPRRARRGGPARRAAGTGPAAARRASAPGGPGVRRRGRRGRRRVVRHRVGRGGTALRAGGGGRRRARDDRRARPRRARAVPAARGPALGRLVTTGEALHPATVRALGRTIGMLDPDRPWYAVPTVGNAAAVLRASVQPLRDRFLPDPEVRRVDAAPYDLPTPRTRGPPSAPWRRSGARTRC